MSKKGRKNGSNRNRRTATQKASNNSQQPSISKSIPEIVLPQSKAKKSDATKPIIKPVPVSTPKQRFSENNLALAGVGIITTALSLLFPGVPLSGVFLIVGWLFITVAVCRHNFFEGGAKTLQQFGNPFIAIALAAVLAMSWTFLQPKPVERKLNAYLVPSDEDSPASKCVIPPNAIAIYFGSSVAYSTKSSFNLFRLRNETLISVERASDGLRLNAILRDKNGEEVARIIKNVFTAYYNSEYDAKNPDAHTVEVFDQKNQVVLFVRYLNPNAIKVFGTFNQRNAKPIIINDEQQGAEAHRMSSNCYGELAQAAFEF